MASEHRQAAVAAREFVSRLSRLAEESAALDPARVAVTSFGAGMTREDVALGLASAVPHFVLWLHRYFRALEELLTERGIVLPDPTVGEIV